MKHLGLFEGIGGFSLAAHMMGWQTVAWCEINPFCQKILKQHFPNAEGLHDITKTDFKKYAVDILTGGFPCQTFSLAGKGAVDLTLWKEMFRAVKEAKPVWVVAENVPGIVGRKFAVAFETVCSDLESAGFEVQTFNIPIAGKGAPHKRERIWFVAYSHGQRCENEQKENRQIVCDEKRHDKAQEQSGQQFECGTVQSDINVTNLHGERLQGNVRGQQSGILKEARTFAGSELSGAFAENEQWSEEWTEVAARLCRVDDGIPDRMDRIKACGNALSPHLALQIFKAINQMP